MKYLIGLLLGILLAIGSNSCKSIPPPPPPPPPLPPPMITEEVEAYEEAVVEAPIEEEEEVPMPDFAAPLEEKVEKNVFRSVEEMPRFPGCEDLEGTAAEKKKCADSTMLAYIYRNMHYPQKAREQGIEGICIVGFTVNKEGRIEDIEVLRNLGGETAKAVKEVIKSMNELPNTFIPGKQGGVPVHVRQNFPIRFKMH
jgi:protein TonB